MQQVWALPVCGQWAAIEGPPAAQVAEAFYKTALSVLLMPVGVMDELPVQLLRLLGLELLPAIGALIAAIHLDPDIDHSAVTGLGCCGNLHRLLLPLLLPLQQLLQPLQALLRLLLPLPPSQLLMPL